MKVTVNVNAVQNCDLTKFRQYDVIEKGYYWGGQSVTILDDAGDIQTLLPNEYTEVKSISE